LTYPGYFSEDEKTVYEQAAIISGFPLIGMCKECMAVGLAYFYQNINDCMNKNVLFIDIGYCKSSFY
jgi:molecular chaperone DnaK (HSP70)